MDEVQNSRTSGYQAEQARRQDLPLPPPSWRRLIPAWLRSLIWIDDLPSYDGFLSYSWAGDKQVATVVQSAIQRFLCPWYRGRAKTIFRDLECLPAGSSLEAELLTRLDRSQHLLVLASPSAAHSRGMEMEVKHWFSRARSGQVLLIVTAGTGETWPEISTNLLPPSLREKLSEPIWADIRSIRKELSSNPVSSAAAGQLTEALNQVLMRLHGGRSWGELRGKERAQRQRALALVLTVSTALFLLSVAASSLAWYADSQREIAVARQLALASSPTPEGLPPAIESLRIRHSQEAVDKLFAALEVVPRLKRKIQVKAQFWPPVYSDDSQYLGIVGDDRVTVWDLARNRVRCEFPAQKAYTMAFSRDQKWAAVGGDNRTFVAALDSCKILWNSAHSGGQMTSLQFSPDGRQLAAAVNDSGFLHWDVQSGKMLSTFAGRTAGRVHFVGFQPAGWFVVWAPVGTGFGLLRTDGTLLQNVATDGQVESVTFSRDGQLMAANIGTAVSVWKSGVTPASDPIVLHHDAFVSNVRVCPDSKHIIATLLDEGVSVWDWSEQSKRILRSSWSSDRIAVAPDCNSIAAPLDGTVGIWEASAGSHTECKLESNCRVEEKSDGFHLFDTLAGTEIGVVYDSYLKQKYIAVSPDGNYRAESASWYEGPVHVVDARTRNVVADPPQATAPLCFISSGVLLTRNRKLGITVWDLSAKRALLSTASNGQYLRDVNAVSCRPDGKQFATADFQQVIVWDAERRAKVETIKTDSQVRVMAFSQDSKLLAFADDSYVHVRDLSKHQTIAAVPAKSVTLGVALSKDNRRLLVYDGKGIFQFPDTARGKVSKYALANACGWHHSMPCGCSLVNPQHLEYSMGCL